jgi:hypothetical protein
VGTIRYRGIRFRAYPNDHPGAVHPHVHAWLDDGEVRIALLADGRVALSAEHAVAVVGTVKASDVRKALHAAAEIHEALLRAWAEMHP